GTNHSCRKPKARLAGHRSIIGTRTCRSPTCTATFVGGVSSKDNSRCLRRRSMAVHSNFSSSPRSQLEPLRVANRASPAQLSMRSEPTGARTASTPAERLASARWPRDNRLSVFAQDLRTRTQQFGRHHAADHLPIHFWEPRFCLPCSCSSV